MIEMAKDGIAAAHCQTAGEKEGNDAEHYMAGCDKK